MKTITLIAALAMTGCVDTTTLRWSGIRHVPTTPEERDKLAKHIECVMSYMPHTASGDDQDLEDIAEEIYRSAPKAVCRPTVWECRGEGWIETGRFRYVEEAK